MNNNIFLVSSPSQKKLPDFIQNWASSEFFRPIWDHSADGPPVSPRSVWGWTTRCTSICRTVGTAAGTAGIVGRSRPVTWETQKTHCLDEIDVLHPTFGACFLRTCHNQNQSDIWYVDHLWLFDILVSAALGQRRKKQFAGSQAAPGYWDIKFQRVLVHLCSFCDRDWVEMAEADEAEPVEIAMNHHGFGGPAGLLALSQGKFCHVAEDKTASIWSLDSCFQCWISFWCVLYVQFWVETGHTSTRRLLLTKDPNSSI